MNRIFHLLKYLSFESDFCFVFVYHVARFIRTLQKVFYLIKQENVNEVSTHFSVYLPLYGANSGNGGKCG